MDISEVRVKLVNRSGERLRAFCSITLDDSFVIRDLKVIGGTNGEFVAMPSRKLSDRCQRCGCKNHLRAKFCNECGSRLNEGRALRDPQGRSKLHADVAHPINSACRERIQAAVMEAFQAELERSKSPDYQPMAYDDYDDDSLEYDGGDEEPRPVRENDRHADERTEAPTDAPGDADVDEDDESFDDEEILRNERDEEESDLLSDYDSLIADLKQEAGRRNRRRDRERGWSPEDDRRAADGGTGRPPEPAGGRPESEERHKTRGRRRDRRRRHGNGEDREPLGAPARDAERGRPADADMPENGAPSEPRERPVEAEPVSRKPAAKEDAGGFGAGL